MFVLHDYHTEHGATYPLSNLFNKAIYHLEMRGSDKMAAIPDLAKDYEEDFKTAILRVGGIIKE